LSWIYNLSSTEEDELAVRGPLNKSQLDIELFPPQPVAINIPHKNLPILIDNADFLPIT
jgi:hypothetical protein